MKIVTRILLGLVFVSLSFTAHAQAEFGRLYTTPSQRIKLDELRNKRPQQEIVVDLVQEDISDITEEESAPVLMNSITLNGLVYRRDGKNTAWINRNSTNTGNVETQFTTVRESDIDSNQVQVLLPDNRTNIRLKVGQQYDVHSQQVYDVVDEPLSTTPVITPGSSRESR